VNNVDRRPNKHYEEEEEEEDLFAKWIACKLNQTRMEGKAQRVAARALSPTGDN